MNHSLLNLDPDHAWLQPVNRVPSPNADDRPPGCDIDLIVIHGISLPPGCFGGGEIQALFCNTLDPRAHNYFTGLQDLRVSAHLLIDREGVLTQFVSFQRRAWHAGASRFQGRESCNDFSIGIELEGTDFVVYTQAQYQALIQVLKLLMSAYPGITRERIVGHCDIAGGRKTDPGGAFDWQRLEVLLG